MKKLTTLFFLLVSITGFSQSSVTTGKWAIGLQFSYDFNQVPDRMDIDGSFGYHNVKPDGLNYTTGITVQVQMSQRLQFISGAMYSDKDVSATVICYTCVTTMYNGPTAYPTYTLNQRYMEVPVLVRYVFTETKITFFTEGGLTGSYLVEGPESNFTEDKNDQLTEFLIGGHVGAGAGAKLGKRFEVNLTFSYKHSFTNFQQDQVFKLKTCSLTTALYYRL